MFVFWIFVCLLTFKQPVMGWRQRFYLFLTNPCKVCRQNYIIANLIGLRHCAKWKSLVILSNLTYMTNMGYILLSLSTCKPLMWNHLTFRLEENVWNIHFFQVLLIMRHWRRMGNSLSLCLNDRVTYSTNTILILDLDCNRPKIPVWNSLRLTSI